MPTYATDAQPSSSRRPWGALPTVALGLVVWAATLLLDGSARASDVAEAPTQLTVVWALVLGAVQGATEFLPVSSSGHLSLGQALLGIDASSVGHRFNITVHAGTLLAVVWVYRKEVVALLRAATRPHQASEDRTRLLMVIVACTPLVVAVFPPVEDMVIAIESHVRWVGCALLVTAAILFFAFRGQRGDDREPTTAPPTARQALLIGLAQLFAIVPGISRSGSTIATGLGVGLDRASAARFSFLISLPAVGAASLKELVEVLGEPAAGPAIDPLPFVVGFATSLVVGLLSLRGLLYLVGKGRVGVFVVYLLIVGAAAIAVG
jgi:undecaprenyl-diphosphatase